MFDLITIDVIPSYIVLSDAVKKLFFGDNSALTILFEKSQQGQVVYNDLLTVSGENDNLFKIHIVGPSWNKTQVFLTENEIKFLGLFQKENSLTAKISFGKKTIECNVVTLEPNLFLSPTDAKRYKMFNGNKIDLEILTGTVPFLLSDINVRVHPTFRTRLELNQDLARMLWITRTTKARIRV